MLDIMQQNTARQFLSLTQATGEYPLSRRKLQQLIKDGRLSAFRLDGKLILKRSDLERLLTAAPAGADLARLVDEVVSEMMGK
jgi:hypothetical protein